MAWAVVTGANRGIGLALVQALVRRGQRVLAVCRASSAELAATGAEVAPGIDVAEGAGLERLRAAVGSRPIDLLINNAGILIHEGQLDALAQDGAAIRQQFEVNAVAPLLVTAALQQNLSPGAKLAFITSRMGSIADNGSGGVYGYRMSKAALNAAAVSIARDLAPRSIAVAILHPGMVSTGMIGGRGQVEPDQAAAGLLARIDELNLENSGTFWHANGEVLPW